MTKKCLTCKSTIIDDLESSIEDELPRLLNCDDKYNPNKTELKKKTPTISEIEVKIPIKSEKNTWVFYWASLPTKELEIKGREAAYGDESNSGLLETDKYGKATLILNCPQPYRINNLTYPRHVHYTTLTKDNVWSDEIKTMVVYCHLDKDQFSKALQSKDHIIINALPEESFQEQKIDGTYNLPVESLNPSNRDDKVRDFIDTHIQKYPSLMDLIEQNKIDEKDIPIITYCQGHGCNASKELSTYIMNAGYKNVVEYPGGIDEWFNDSDDDSSDDDEPSFFEDGSKYNLDNKYETIIINNIKYKHQLDDLNYILDEDDQKVGKLINHKIVWDTEHEKITNEFLSDEDEDEDEEGKSDDEKDTSSSDDDEKDTSSSDDDEKDTSSSNDDEKDTSSSDDDEKDTSSSDDDEKDTSSSDDEDNDDEKKKGGAPNQYGWIYSRSLISKKEYDQLFRGWGFSFF